MSAPPGDLPELRSQLDQALQRVWREVAQGYLRKQLYTGFRDEVIARHPEADATFLNVYSLDYASSQIMRIRRLADSGEAPRPDSLWWIVERIRKNRALANREALVDAVRKRQPDDPSWADEADRWFTAKFGEDASEVPDLVLDKWHEVLREDLADLLDFADRELAHLDPVGPRLKVTYRRIHDALDDVAETYNEVAFLLSYSQTNDWEVIIQGDWQQVFRPGLFHLD